MKIDQRNITGNLQSESEAFNYKLKLTAWKCRFIIILNNYIHSHDWLRHVTYLSMDWNIPVSNLSAFERNTRCSPSPPHLNYRGILSYRFSTATSSEHESNCPQINEQHRRTSSLELLAEWLNLQDKASCYTGTGMWKSPLDGWIGQDTALCHT